MHLAKKTKKNSPFRTEGWCFLELIFTLNRRENYINTHLSTCTLHALIGMAILRNLTSGSNYNNLSSNQVTAQTETTLFGSVFLKLFLAQLLYTQWSETAPVLVETPWVSVLEVCGYEAAVCFSPEASSARSASVSCSPAGVSAGLQGSVQTPARRLCWVSVCSTLASSPVCGSCCSARKPRKHPLPSYAVCCGSCQMRLPRVAGISCLEELGMWQQSHSLAEEDWSLQKSQTYIKPVLILSVGNIC